jgi:hypothetical protein
MRMFLSLSGAVDAVRNSLIEENSRLNVRSRNVVYIFLCLEWVKEYRATFLLYLGGKNFTEDIVGPVSPYKPN